MQPRGRPWTPLEIAALIGDERVIELPWGTVTWRILDARMTSDPRRAELLVEAA